MKRTVENADGMYPEVRETAETLTDAKKLFAKFAAQANTVDTINRMAQQANEVLATESNENRRTDANEVLAYARALHTSLKESTISRQQIAADGIFLGRAYEKMCVRRHEENVIHSTKTKRGLSKGRAEKAEKDDARRNKIRALTAARMATHPRDSLTYARQIVAGKMNIALNTVRKATVGMKMPHKKIKK